MQNHAMNLKFLISVICVYLFGEGHVQLKKIDVSLSASHAPS